MISAPLALEDVASRDPYEKGDEAALSMIYAIDRAGQLKELSSLSKVVAALKEYSVYRVYWRDNDGATKEKLENLIGDFCHV